MLDVSDARANEVISLRDRIDALPMPLNDYLRYGRQMILDNFGLPGQLRLREASVLTVGAGGLGCPALLYLCGAGIGKLSILDNDTVEVSNLHRQILHTEARLGMLKAESARMALIERNSNIQIDAMTFHLNEDTLGRLKFADFDLVLDCTDNATTRYLLNDACIAARVPLVSGAALRMDGQVVVWNLPLSTMDPEQRGPCYRCLFAPPSQTTGSERCAEEGVLGTLTGTIGTLMATEAIKLLTGQHEHKPAMLLYSPLATPPFRSLTMRSRRKDCLSCGSDRAAVDQQSTSSLCEKLDTQSGPRLTATQVQEQLRSSTIIDLRRPAEYSICALPGSINVPFSRLIKNPSTALPPSTDKSFILVCRQGNDSHEAARILQKAGFNATDMVGGLQSWSREIDVAFPLY